LGPLRCVAVSNGEARIAAIEVQTATRGRRALIVNRRVPRN
jgi:hypothetical protein